MNRKFLCPEGWVRLKDAADVMGMHYQTLRDHVNSGEFTRLRRTPGQNAAIYLPQIEVDTYKRGGLEAVQKLRLKTKKAATKASQLAGA